MASSVLSLRAQHTDNLGCQNNFKFQWVESCYEVTKILNVLSASRDVGTMSAVLDLYYTHSAFFSRNNSERQKYIERACQHFKRKKSIVSCVFRVNNCMAKSETALRYSSGHDYIAELLM